MAGALTCGLLMPTGAAAGAGSGLGAGLGAGHGHGLRVIAIATPATPGGGPLSCTEVEAIVDSALGTANRALEKVEALPPNPTPLQLVGAVGAVTVQVTTTTALVGEAILSLELIQLEGEGCPTLEALLRIIAKLTEVDTLLDFVATQLPLLLNPLLPPSQVDAIIDAVTNSLQDTIALLEAALQQLGEPPPPPPANDHCVDAMPAEASPLPFTTVGATSSVPFPLGCTGLGLELVVPDVWFTWTASCNGTATISVCNSADFDTVLAVYAGGCADPVLVDCNDDASGCGSTSSVSFEARCDDEYFIRIGAVDEVGSGSIEITCTGTCLPCIGDLNDDGVIDGADLGILLAAWNQRGEPDFTGDGVVDGADLGILLANWGLCP